MHVGIIGLGNIGGHVAANLVADGHEVTVFDTDEVRSKPLVEAGATAAPGPAEVAKASEITLLSLPTPEVVNAVADAWLKGASKGDILVDISTNSPEAVRELGVRVSAAGCELLDAPLTGGAAGAESRMLVFMVGGDAKAFQRCEPLLSKLGRAVFHLGPLGLGNTAKLVNSLLAFTSTWVSLEGLSMAAKAGIDVRTMVDVVRTGGAGNFFMDRMVESINERGRPAQFALALAAKDARLIEGLSEATGVPAPIGSQLRKILDSAVDAGLGDHDWSDLVEHAEKEAGIPLQIAPAEESTE
jgi:3-hydroxyisobutyrate dehydrogenase-like beta-hydroxyacid dehydrogenase